MYRKFSDEQLLQRLSEGEKKAFDELYTRYWEQLTMYALKFVRSTDDASDILQDVFIAIWKRRSTLIITTSLKAYLYRSVHNLALRCIRNNIHKADFLASLNSFTHHLEAPATKMLEKKELDAWVNNEVSKLPGKMQKVFILRKDGNLSYKQIAERLGIAETTVKKQVNNALKFIKAEVRGSGMILLLAFLLTYS